MNKRRFITIISILFITIALILSLVKNIYGFNVIEGGTTYGGRVLMTYMADMAYEATVTDNENHYYFSDDFYSYLTANGVYSASQHPNLNMAGIGWPMGTCIGGGRKSNFEL